MNEQSRKDFQGSENTLYDSIMVGIRLRTQFFEAHRMYRTKNET